MTMHDLFRLVGRRWYVYAAGVLTVIAVVFVLDTMPRIYTATAELQFNEPKHLPAALEGKDHHETLIYYTGAVASRYDAEYPSVALSSPTATLFGNGLREGVAVELAATGNQWTMAFVRPVVVIHVASTRSEDILPTFRRVAGEMESISRSLQSEAGAEKNQQITTSMDLDLVTVYSFGQTRTGRVGGTAVLLSAAMILSTLTARFLDRFKLWRAQVDLEPGDPSGPPLTNSALSHG